MIECDSCGSTNDVKRKIVPHGLVLYKGSVYDAQFINLCSSCDQEHNPHANSFLICESCGSINYIFRTIDPHRLEIYEEPEIINICDSCYDDLPDET